MPHIVLNLDAFCPAVDEIVHDLQARAKQDDVGELLERERERGMGCCWNQLMIERFSKRKYTYSFHIFWSSFEHGKASVGERKQKCESADPGKVKNRIAKNLGAETKAFPDQVGWDVAKIKRTSL